MYIHLETTCITSFSSHITTEECHIKLAGEYNSYVFHRHYHLHKIPFVDENSFCLQKDPVSTVVKAAESSNLGLIRIKENQLEFYDIIKHSVFQFFAVTFNFRDNTAALYYMSGITIGDAIQVPLSAARRGHTQNRLQ